MEFVNYGKHYQGIDSHGEAFVDHSNKLIYINIPRCASSTIKRYITNYELPFIREKHYNYRDYKRFAIIREPIDRIISTLCVYLTGRRVEDYKLNEFDFIKGEYYSLQKRIELFVECMKTNAGIDPHCQLQTWHLTDVNYDIMHIDYLIPFENMFAYIEQLFKQFYKIDIIEHATNVSKKEIKNDISNIIRNDINIKNNLYQIYKPDFLLYNSITAP